MRVRWVVAIGLLSGGVFAGCGGDTKGGTASGGATSTGGATVLGGDAGAREPGGEGGIGGEAAGSGGAGGTASGGAAAGTGGQAVSGGAPVATGGQAVSGGAGAGGASSSIECVIAVRVDECCSEPRAKSQAELEADGCLTEYPLSLTEAEIVERCPEADRSACALVDCAAPEPPSRVVAADADGTCQFVNECESAGDCTVALALDRCCPCPESFPNTLIEEEHCIVPIAASFRPSDCVFCAGALCAPCPPVEGTPVCESIDAGPARCTLTAP